MMAFVIGTTYFLSLLASLLLFYAVGKAIRWYWIRDFFPKNFFSDVFFSLLVGQIATVFLYTIFCSEGQTIQWVFLIPTFFIVSFFNENKPVSTSASVSYLKILSIFGVVLICFLWEAIFFLRFNGFPFSLTFIDNIYYSKLSHFLGVTGQENYWCMENYLLGNKESGIALYHFYEMWLNSLISRLFGLLNLPAFLLVSQPTFHCIGFIGILAIIENFEAKFNFTHFIIGFLLLFVSTVYFSFYERINFLEYADIIFFHFLGHVSKKTGIYYMLSIAFMLLMHRKEIVPAFCAVFCLPVMTVTAFPFLVGGTGLAIIIFFIFSILEKKEVYRLTAFLFAFTISYLIVYLLLRDINSVMTPDYALSGFFKNNFSELWTKAKLIIGTALKVAFLLSPFILLILISLKIKQLFSLWREHRLTIIFCFTNILVGLVTWAVLNQIEDMFQLFIGTLSLLNVFVIYLIIKYIKPFYFLSWKQSFISLALIFVLIYNLLQQIDKQKFQYPQRKTSLNLYLGYSENYLEKIHSLIEKKQISGFGGSLIAKVDYERSPYNMMLHIMRLGEYLGLMSSDCYTVSLNDLDLPLSNTLRVHYLSKLPFFQFASKQKQEGKFESEAKSQVEFIKKYNLSFVILSPNAQISEDMKPLIKEIITDELSGEKFLLLF
jgi:hypothetical protein